MGYEGGTLTLTGKPEESHKSHAKAVHKSLKAAREPLEADWHAIADYSGYRAINLRETGMSGKELPKMRQLIDSYPILAFRTVEAGMYSGLSSPNRPWLKFGFLDDDLQDYQPARVYLGQLERLILRMFDASNFYQVARKNYGQMARFGPACGIMTEHWSEVAPCLPVAIGDFWLGVNDAFKTDQMVRNVQMTVNQVVKSFVKRGDRYDWSIVSPAVKNMWDKSNYEAMVSVRQMIEPCGDGKFASCIWDDKDDRPDKMLEAKKYGEQPFWGPCWDGDGAYGRALGHDALPDMRELHMQAKSKRELTDQIRKPATYGPARDLDMRPGAHTHVADMTERMRIEPIYVPAPSALLEVRQDLRERYEMLDRLAYADLFMAISNMPGIQPRNVEEIIKRDEEKLSQIGPVVEMVNDDMLPIAVERMIGIARRGDLLPEAPEELQGRELKIEFVSVLAMAQKMIGMSTTERVVGFVGSVSQVFGPQVIDKIDADKLIDDYATRANLPAESIRDEQTVAAFRKQREEASRMEQMASMAQPANAATQAAANLLELSQQGV